MKARVRLPLLAVLVLSVSSGAAAFAAEEEGAGEAGREAGAGPVEGVAGTGAGPAADAEEPAAVRADTSTNGGSQEAAEHLKWAVDGYVTQRLRVRGADGDTDIDSSTYVVADGVRRGERTLRVRVNGLLHGSVTEAGPNEPLRDIWDGFEHDVQFRLYEGYFEATNVLDPALTLRGGRQFVDEGVYLHFDGLRLDADLAKHWKGVDLSAFFGKPVHFPDDWEDHNWLAGLVVRVRVDRKTRVRLDYVHVAEAFPGINAVVVDPQAQPVSVPAERLDDDLLGLTVWHRLRDTIRLFGRFSLLNWDANELHLRVRWFTKDGRWNVVGEFYELFGRLQNVTNDLTPFVPMLGSYEPFIRFTLRATRRVGEEWTLQGGLSFRALLDEDDEGTFNHEYVNYYLSATRFELADGRLDVTLIVNGYDSSLNDIVAIGGQGNYRLTPEVDLSGGVDYALYKYVWFQDTERENVWTYFVRVRWRATKKVDVRGELSVDDDRFDTYTTFLVQIRVKF